jgi:hypothetical protein
MSQSSGLVLWKTSGPAAALDSEERQLAEVFLTPDACRLTPGVRGNSKPPTTGSNQRAGRLLFLRFPDTQID